MRRWFLGLETELLRVRFKHVLVYRDDREKFFDYYKDDFDFNIVKREDCEVRASKCVCNVIIELFTCLAAVYR